MSRYTINKIDASRRQLKQAIKMFFYDEDDLAIHTIAHAALEVLRVISSAKGNKYSLTSNGWGVVVNKNQQKEWYDKNHKIRNFLKHSSSKYDESVEFDPFLNIVAFLDCLLQLEKAKTNIPGCEWNWEEKLIFTYIFLEYPNFFDVTKNPNFFDGYEPYRKTLVKLNLEKNLDENNKYGYLELFNFLSVFDYISPLNKNQNKIFLIFWKNCQIKVI